ncbi:MAG: ribonuclease HII [Candidatus Omnitrophota bacterium]
MLSWEKKAFLNGASLIIGVDEAGRGPLAGPVVAGATALKPHPLDKFSVPAYNTVIDDSKKLSPSQREKAFKELSKKTLCFVGVKSHSFIDKNNIYQATLAAMKAAVTGLVRDFCAINKKRIKDIRKNTWVLVDGNAAPDLPYKTVPIIKGDSKSLSIAAASIVAKVTRDRMMDLYDKKYPVYGFSRHKGYGTRFHVEAIQKYGACPIHRKTFAPIRQDGY